MSYVMKREIIDNPDEIWLSSEAIAELYLNTVVIKVVSGNIRVHFDGVCMPTFAIGVKDFIIGQSIHNKSFFFFLAFPK